jgi:hypothetical protein
VSQPARRDQRVARRAMDAELLEDQEARRDHGGHAVLEGSSLMARRDHIVARRAMGYKYFSSINFKRVYLCIRKSILHDSKGHVFVMRCTSMGYH